MMVDDDAVQGSCTEAREMWNPVSLPIAGQALIWAGLAIGGAGLYEPMRRARIIRCRVARYGMLKMQQPDQWRGMAFGHPSLIRSWVKVNKPSSQTEGLADAF